MTINAQDWNSFVDGLMGDVLPAAARAAAPKRATPKLLPNGEAKPRSSGRTPMQARAAQQWSAFREANDAVITVIQDAAKWSDFARSLAEQLAQGRIWSERQLAAAQSMAAKIIAKRDAQAAAPAAPSVDLSAIEAMFATATASGYKKPAYRANGLVIKPHWDGAGLAVYNEERMVEGSFGPKPGYDGKVAGGKFIAVRACPVATPHKLATIAADPKGEAIRHGQRTGTCSCCGRELTKHASIDLGIGPICAQKWGF